MQSVSGILEVFDALGCGAVLMDNSGRVLNTNGRAQRYLGSAFDISRRTASGAAAAMNLEMQSALREALRASTQVVPQLGEYITVPRPHSRPLLLRSVLFRDGQATTGDATVAAIVLLDMDDCPFPDDDLLRDVFLMTPAEVRLAQRLSRGESLAAIAGDLGLSAGTLRVQLKRLFQKTATSRQGELIALLAHMTRLNGK